jgi:hypothetical protein
MTITSKYPGRCTVCGKSFPQGTQVEWQKGGGARHVKCPEQAATPSPSALLASVPGGAQSPAGRNRRSAHCDSCGAYIPAGAGRLVRCYADTGCMEHFDDDGWHVYCLDGEACKVRAEQARKDAVEAAARAKASAEAEKTARLEQVLAYKATRAQVTAGLIEVDVASAPWQGGPELAHCKDFYDCSLHRGSLWGEEIIVEHAHAYDDDRTTIWVPRHLVADIYDEAAMHITMAAAKYWLAHYRGCVGTDMYEYAAQRGE